MRAITKGATDQSVVIRIIDSADGTPETAVEHNSSGIDLWYRREGATKTSITEAALAALDSAHADGGIEHIGDGYYRLDLPDAAVASGSNGVAVGGTVTGMVVIGCYVHLVDYDPQNAVRLGLTALPNAAADGAGGLPISDAGGLDLDARIGVDIPAILVDTGTTLQAEVDGIQADTEDIQTRLPAALVGGRIDASVGAMAANVMTAAAAAADLTTELQSGLATAAAVSTLQTSVDDLPTNAELATSQAAADDATLAAIAALNNLSSAQAQTAAAAALTAYDPPTNAEMEARTLTAAQIAKLVAHLTGVLTVIVGSGSTTTSVVLNASTGINGGAPSSANDFYNGRVLVFISGALAGQATDITDYVGSTVTMTVTALTGAPSAADTAILV